MSLSRSLAELTPAKGRTFLRHFRDLRNVGESALAVDAEFGHSAFEGSGLQLEKCGRAVLAAYAPVGQLEGVQDVVPLGVLHCHALGDGGIGYLRRRDV